MRAMIVVSLSLGGAILMALFLSVAPAAAQTPTPWPTPNATSVFSSTQSGPGPQMPAAIPLAPLDDTIDFALLWDIDNFIFMASAVITVFDLENINEFFSIVIPFIGMELSLRWAYRRVANGGKYSSSEEV